MSEPETTIAKGVFEVDLNPIDNHAEGLDGMSLGRMTLDKKYSGDLVGSSSGEMLFAMTPVEGSAGYVAIEQVQGTLHGRSGSFILQHFGARREGAGRLVVEVVPDSGTADLIGLAGEMTIAIDKKVHAYQLAYKFVK